jgi:hypothetical protein
VVRVTTNTAASKGAFAGSTVGSRNTVQSLRAHEGLIDMLDYVCGDLGVTISDPD